MAVKQALPFGNDDLTDQLTWIIALWLLFTFTMAFTLTVFLP